MEVPIDILDRLTLPPGMWLTVDWFEAEGLTLNLHARVRDSRNALRELEIVTPYRIPEELAGSEIGMASLVRQVLITFAVHEIDEWLALDGELLNDPHALGAFKPNLEWL